MATNTISCDWLSSTEIVGDVAARKLSVTDIVSQCANVCEVVFESRGPAGDVTGEGVKISYFIQVALACLFAGTLPEIIKLIDIRSWSAAIRAIPLLRKLQKLFYQISAFFSVSILIACMVRYYQNPSALEIIMFQYLLFAQFMVDITLFYCHIQDLTINDNKVSRSTVSGKLLIYYLALSLATLGIGAAMDPPHRTTYYDFAKACHSQRDLPKVESWFEESGTVLPKWFGIGCAIGVALVIVGFILVAILAQVGIIRRFVNMLPAWLRREWFTIFALPFFAYYVLNLIFLTMRTNALWELVKEASGQQYSSSNKWGYGQITAILIWFPFFWTAVSGTIKYCKGPTLDELIEANMREKKDQKQPSLSPLSSGPVSMSKDSYPPPPPPHRQPESKSAGSTVPQGASPPASSPPGDLWGGSTPPSDTKYQSGNNTVPPPYIAHKGPMPTASVRPA